MYHYTNSARTFVSNYPWQLIRGILFSPRGTAQSGTARCSQFVNTTLNKNAALRHITHPTISSIHVNCLSSNEVMEDRHAVHFCPQTGAALLTVIDGHNGSSCAEHIKQSIATYVTNHLNRAETNVVFSDIFESPEIAHSSLNTLRNTEAEEELIKKQLKNSFVDLDSDISEVALNAIKQAGINTGLRSHVQLALTGACVNALLLYGRNTFVANTGDCRSILGRREGGSWVSVPLSTDHTCRNQNEVARILKEHPGEERTVLKDARLLGSLMPLRSFGDVEFKWRKDHLRTVGQYILPGYYTPPYLTAEPEVTHQHLTKDDKFVVIATDGLWECLTSEEVVDIVGDKLIQKFDGNIATILIKQALGPNDYEVYNLLKLRPPESRYYRDDITIIVVTFK